jgi:hypothetical protein
MQKKYNSIFGECSDSQLLGIEKGYRQAVDNVKTTDVIPSVTPESEIYFCGALMNW